jgi:hypothetical protein
VRTIAAILLAAAAGERYIDIQKRLGCSSQTIARYLLGYRRDGELPRLKYKLRTPPRPTDVIRKASLRAAIRDYAKNATRENWSRRRIAATLNVSPMTVSRHLAAMGYSGGRVEPFFDNRPDWSYWPDEPMDTVVVVGVFIGTRRQAIAFKVIPPYGNPPRHIDIGHIFASLTPYRPRVHGWDHELRTFCQFITTVRQRYRVHYVLTWNLPPKRRRIVQAHVRRYPGMRVLLSNSFSRWYHHASRYVGIWHGRKSGTPYLWVHDLSLAMNRAASLRVPLAWMHPGAQQPTPKA